MNRIIANEKFLKFNDCFGGCYITGNFELVVDKKNNIYFRLDDVTSDIEFDCKVLEFISRYCFTGVSKKKQEWFRNNLKKYGFDFSELQWDIIYTEVGNSCNRKLTIEFLEKGFDFSIFD